MEKSVNKVELNGFVGANPEIIETKNGGKFARFSVATSENYKNRDGEWITDTTWHNIVAWNKIAETIEKHIKKGTRLSLMGKLVNRNYTGKDGQKHYITEIQMSSYEVVETTKKEENIAA